MWNRWDARRPAPMTVLVAALVLVAGGCSGGAGSTTAAQQGAGAAVVGPDGAPTPSTAFVVDRKLPFAAYADAVARVLGGDDGLEEAAHTAVEDLVAACMKDEGFEYTPLEHEPPGAQPSGAWARGTVAFPVLPSDRGDVEAYGYGTDDVETLEKKRTAAETPDVNNVYLASLEPAAQEAYLETMGGSGLDSDLGCRGRAVLEVVGEQPTVSSLAETYGELVQEMNHLAVFGVEADPRGRALLEEWVGCMAADGHDVAKPDDEAGFGWPAGPMQAYDLAIATSVDGTVDPAHRDMDAADIPLDGRYLVGSDAEHAIALADFDCRASTGLETRWVDLLADLEADFVTDHQVALEQLLAATADR